MAWGAVSADGAGLALITHGLQGLGGTSTLNLMLLRQVSDGGRPNSEGITEQGYQTLRYAYLPHAGNVSAAQIGQAAAAFNQPLIAAWRADQRLRVQLPFAMGASRSIASNPAARSLPQSFSLLSADRGMVVDLYRRGDRVEAVMINFDPQLPVILTSGAQQFTAPQAR